MNSPYKQEVYSIMDKYWSSYSANDNTFWLHEYNKHGYCFTQRNNLTDFFSYFNFTVNFFMENQFSSMFYDAFYQPNTRLFEVHKQELDMIIQTLYPGAYYKFVCGQKGLRRYLLEIYFYYDMDFKFRNTPYPPDENCGGKDEYISIIFEPSNTE